MIDELRRLVDAIGPGLLHQQLSVDQLLQLRDPRVLRSMRRQGFGRCSCASFSSASGDLFAVDDGHGLARGLFLAAGSGECDDKCKNDTLTHELPRLKN